jgi:hypothetical protein
MFSFTLHVGLDFGMGTGERQLYFSRIGLMCNCYRITPKKGADKGVRAKVSAAVGKFASSLVRPSDPGIVVL